MPMWSGSLCNSLSCLGLIALVIVSGFTKPARADFGPKPQDRQHFAVTLEGGSLPNSRFVAAMLCLRPKLKEQPDNLGAVVPGLKVALPPDDSGDFWTYADYKWGGNGANGQVEFHGFYGNVPKIFRIAVYLPFEKRLFLTNEAHTHPLLNRFRVDLASDGTATLTRDESGQWFADGLVGLARRGIFFALGITLIVELAVIVSLAIGLKKQRLLGRLIIVCLLINLLTLPVLWGISLIGFWLIGLRAGLALLFLLELAVVWLEGLAYATAGRICWQTALTVALLANAASLLVGMMISN